MGGDGGRGSGKETVTGYIGQRSEQGDCGRGQRERTVREGHNRCIHLIEMSRGNKSAVKLKKQIEGKALSFHSQ